MRKSVRPLTGVLLAGVLAAGGVLAVAAPAVAAPSNCSVTESDTGAQVVCASGTGQYRIAVLCESPWTGQVTERNGPFVQVGQTSARTCRFGELVVGSAVDTGA